MHIEAADQNAGLRCLARVVAEWRWERTLRKVSQVLAGKHNSCLPPGLTSVQEHVEWTSDDSEAETRLVERPISRTSWAEVQSSGESGTSSGPVVSSRTEETSQLGREPRPHRE